MALLEVRGLRAGFGANPVLHGIDLDVHQGEVVSVLGLNGAGKSVTLKVVGGLLPAWGGTVTFDGAPVTGLSVEARVARGMAHVPQGRQLFPELTVAENLRLGAYLPRRRDRSGYDASLAEMLDRFPRLAERLHQAAGTMSGGEQAMLAVARALMAKPKLLLVDEPSAGLAPRVAGEIVDLLREVNRTGVTVLLIEQNVPLALRAADRAYVMQRGRVVHQAPVADLDPGDLGRYLGIGRLLAPVLATPVSSNGNGTTPHPPARSEEPVAVPAAARSATAPAPARKRTWETPASAAAPSAWATPGPVPARPEPAREATGSVAQASEPPAGATSTAGPAEAPARAQEATPKNTPTRKRTAAKKSATSGDRAATGKAASGKKKASAKNKATGTKAAAKKATGSKASAKKAAASKAAAKKATAKKATGGKTTAKKATGGKAAARTAAAKKKKTTSGAAPGAASTTATARGGRRAPSTDAAPPPDATVEEGAG